MSKKKLDTNYTYNDLINFEKLESVHNYKIKLNNKKNINHPIKYTASDNKYFKKIINKKSSTDEKYSKNIKIDAANKNYYNSLDNNNFEKIKQFQATANNEFLKKKDASENITDYKKSDLNAFELILKSSNKANITNSTIDNKKIKIIDFDKTNNIQKNKLGVEKIKVIYFD